MGIQGLISRLRPYAQPVAWERLERPGNGKVAARVIIDGPSLAHFIYGQLVSSHSSAQNALRAIPSYASIADETILWLNRLENYGLLVTHIFFDGILPRNKRGTRIERLDNYLKRLQGYRRRNPGDSTDISQKSALVHRNSLPAVGFLVPIVVEALLASRYSIITKVIPGEADEFCASAVNSVANGIVITSDSDLLILCPQRTVVFFDDVEWTDGAELKGICFHPADIALRFDCDDFCKLAFVMSKDAHRTAPEGALFIKEAEKGLDDAARIWYRGLTASEQSPLTRLAASHDGLQSFLYSVDSRVSELLHDWARKQELARSATDSSDAKESIVRVYLPFLIEDPLRSSPWKPSRMIREIAYDVLLSLGKGAQFSEVHRSGEVIKEHSIATGVELDVETLLDASPSLPTVEHQSDWHKYFIRRLLQDIPDTGAARPELSVVMDAVFGSDCEEQWAVRHFRAQLEATMYSTRMLKLVVDFVHLFVAASRVRLISAIKEQIRRLQEALSLLPSIRKLMLRPCESLGIDDADGSFRRELYKTYGTTEKEQLDVQDTQHKKRRKITRGTHGQAPKPGSSNNMFSLLPDE